MSPKQFLAAIKIFCVAQFILVLLFVVWRGLQRSEMFFILISAVFGLVCDGFFQTVAKASKARSEKDKLDQELTELMSHLDREMYHNDNS